MTSNKTDKPLFLREELEKHWGNGTTIKLWDKEYGVIRNNVKRYCLVPFDQYKNMSERQVNVSGEIPLSKIDADTYEISNSLNELKN